MEEVYNEFAHVCPMRLAPRISNRRELYRQGEEKEKEEEEGKNATILDRFYDRSESRIPPADL